MVVVELVMVTLGMAPATCKTCSQSSVLRACVRDGLYHHSEHSVQEGVLRRIVSSCFDMRKRIGEAIGR